MNDPRNCLYSENVISYAIEKGYYDPESGQPFSFCDAYCPPTPMRKRLCEGRVWSIFNRAAPSQGFSPDYYRRVKDADPYPLWVKPDHKLSIAHVFALMRDHFEGTDWDMGKGLDAGPHGLPYRWRPVIWTIDDIDFAWERAISTQQTAYSFVSQSRSWLPDPIGGVYWYGLDDTWYTVYMPFYCGNDKIPECLASGNYNEFSWECAFWVFNFVSNYSYIRYEAMITDIQHLQSELEGNLLALQPDIEKTALELYRKDPERMAHYLNDHSMIQARKIVDQWRELGENLIVKYVDGYVKDENGEPQWQGYNETWLNNMADIYPDELYLEHHKEEESEE